jgi:hypothetical protein
MGTIYFGEYLNYLSQDLIQRYRSPSLSGHETPPSLTFARAISSTSASRQRKASSSRHGTARIYSFGQLHHLNTRTSSPLFKQVWTHIVTLTTMATSPTSSGSARLPCLYTTTPNTDSAISTPPQIHRTSAPDESWAESYDSDDPLFLVQGYCPQVHKMEQKGNRYPAGRSARYRTRTED